MHSIGIWLGGIWFQYQGKDMLDRGYVPAPGSLADPGAGILAKTLFLLERPKWEAETGLGSWENSVSEFSTSRTAEGWAVLNTEEDGTLRRTLEARCASTTKVSPHSPCERSAVHTGPSPVAGFKDVVSDSLGAF